MLGGVDEETHVMKSDEYSNEFQKCFRRHPCGGKPEIAARIETIGDQFRESVGCEK